MFLAVVDRLRSDLGPLFIEPREDFFFEERSPSGNFYNIEAIRGYLSTLLTEIQAEVAEFARGADVEFMKLAIAEARKSVPEDSRPRPRVGVVIVKDGAVLASAHRGELGPGDHAEFTALEKKVAEVGVAGATVYTTLEPCTTRNHPKVACAMRLVERKVARVVIGMIDPDRRISGDGVRMLRNANIGVEFFTAECMGEVEELNREVSRTVRPSAPPRPRLEIEIPEPRNPVGGISAGSSFTPSWNLRIRFIAHERPLDIVEMGFEEEGVGSWKIEEIADTGGRPRQLPLHLEFSAEVWLRGTAPGGSATRRPIGRMTLRVRDHTQPKGEYHEVLLKEAERG